MSRPTLGNFITNIPSTNYPHLHMRTGSQKEKKKYLLFKRNIFKKFKVNIVCDHCDWFFSETEKSSFSAFDNSINQISTSSYIDFTENVTSNQKTVETTNCNAARRSDAAVYKVTHRHKISETVKYNVTSHHQSSETVSRNIARPQSTGTVNFPKANFARQNNSGMTNVSKTNLDLHKQQPSISKEFPKEHPDLPKAQLQQKPIIPTNLTRGQVKYIQMVNRNPFEVALNVPPKEPSKKRYRKKKKKLPSTRTLSYRPPGGSTVPFIPPDEADVADLTDQEMPHENTQQPLVEIKINIANKSSSSKMRTVTIEGEDNTADKAPHETSYQEEKSVQDDISTVDQSKNTSTSTDSVTNEKLKEGPKANKPPTKPKSTNKPPFFVQPTSTLTDRAMNKRSANPGHNYKPISDRVNVNESVTQTVLNPTKQNYVSNFLKSIEDPLSNFCGIHQKYVCPCQDKRTLTVITPVVMETNTQQISKTPSHQSRIKSVGAGYKRNIPKEIVPSVPPSNPQESEYHGVLGEWSLGFRAGVPLSFRNKMMGERLAPPAHEVPQHAQGSNEIMYVESDSCQDRQWEKPWMPHPTQSNQEVVHLDSDSDWECRRGACSPDSSTLPDLLLSVYCNSGDSETTKNQPRERKKPETQSRTSKKRKIKAESSKIPTTPQPPTKYVPILERSDIVCSMDTTVKSLAKLWPWEKNIKELLSVSHDGDGKQNKIYKNIVEESKQENPAWTKVTVTGYPTHWDRHRLLDTLITWREMSSLPLTPCFIEFNSHECKFLVCHNERALYALYDRGLVLHEDDFRLNLSVTQLGLHQNMLRFRLTVYLGFRLSDRYDKAKRTVDLTAFLREQDISMMCHFPLRKLYNQQRIVEMKSKVRWKTVTKLILAKNFLTTLEGFNFQKRLPSLKELDLSDNLFTSSTQLSCCHGMLSVKSVRLEGNPFCVNFVHQDEYVAVALLLFPMLDYLDGVKISGIPEPRKNFCPYPEAQPIVDRFMELYFNLLESKSRSQLCAMYSPGSVFTLACQSRLKKLPEYEDLDMVRACRDVRLLNEMMDESYVGNEEIAQRLASWAPVTHDLDTFTVDVMLHSETSVILTVTGCLRVQSDPDREDGPLLDFSRTFVLSSRDGAEYVINNDLWYLAEPVEERKNTVFKTQRPKPAPSLQLENAPDEDLKSELIDIMMKLTKLDRYESQRCLEFRNWDLRCALQYFIELLEVNEVATLSEVR